MIWNDRGEPANTLDTPVRTSIVFNVVTLLGNVSHLVTWASRKRY